MLGNSFGRLFKITTCGESYSGAFNHEEGVSEQLKGGLMVIVDGVPPGVTLTHDMIQSEMNKRRPGQSEMDTPRKERDKAHIYSGVMENQLTTGAPIGIIIPNSDILEEQIEKHRVKKHTLRPGQATYTYFKKYGEHFDWLGAGRASGRETAARVAGGAVAKAVLDQLGIDVVAFVTEIYGVKAAPISYEMAKANYRKNELNCPDLEKGLEMVSEVLKAKDQGESLGGVIEVIVKGMPIGVGEPVFDKLDAVLSHALMSLGAVKGIEFGAGFSHTLMKGSESNDVPYVDENTKKVTYKTNHSGGISGGISTGEEIRIRVAVKATPTVSVDQNTVNVKDMKELSTNFSTRNDPTICARIYAVCEAMVRITILDALYMSMGYQSVICALRRE